MNEELRSAGEELETGREELQSVNEELTTVNAEFKNRVEELGRTNSDLHNLINATQIATVFLGRKLQIMRYTPPAAPLFNLIPGDTGRPIAHLKQRLDYPELTSDAEQVLRTLVPVERELRDGGRWFMARVLPYRTVEDHIGGVVLTFVDITAWKRAEDAVRASEEKLSAFVSATSEVIYEMSADWREMRFLEGKEFIASTDSPRQDWMDVYLPGDEQARVWAAIDEAIRTGSIFELEHRVIRLDGQVGWAFSRAIPVRGDQGQVVKWFGAASDITERRETEQALARNHQVLVAALREKENARAETEAAGKAKDHFLAVLSHELRTPLTPVLMAVHTLARDKTLPPPIQSALEMIKRNVGLEIQLVDDLLDITRISRGKIELLSESMDLHAALRNALEVSTPEIEQKQQRLTVDLAATRHLISGDAKRLQQVFWNLLKNASKFTPERGTIEVRSRNEADQDRGGGPGFRDRFFRGSQRPDLCRV